MSKEKPEKTTIQRPSDKSASPNSLHVMMLLVSYPPVIDSGARLYSELSENLRNMGHRVTVIAEHPAPNFPVDRNHEYFTGKCTDLQCDNEVVLRVSPLSFMSKIPGGKALRFWISCALFALRGIFTKRPDVILVYSPPLFMGVSGYIISKVRRTRFVFNLQDIHPKVLFDSGVIKNPLIKAVFNRMEELCYKKAHSLIAYSMSNKDHIVRRGADEAKVFIIPNWTEIKKTDSNKKEHSFRNEEVVGDKFVVSYAGTIQQAQGLENVVYAADLLRDFEEILFLLAGEGVSKPFLEALIAEKKLKNVFLRPVMPKDEYRQFISDSDVCLITLSPETPMETVPGKLADIMGYGKPVILAASPEGDAARVVRNAECGFCVKPGDVKAFSVAVLKLYRDGLQRKKMGENAIFYAEQNFARSVCTKKFEKLLSLAAINNDPCK